MMPEAWNVEHNNRHHYCLSELDDPDLVEENLVDLRNMNIPMAAKYAIVLFNMVTWKWFYYAPNTYKELKLAQWRRTGKSIPQDVQPELSILFHNVMMGIYLRGAACRLGCNIENVVINQTAYYGM